MQVSSSGHFPDKCLMSEIKGFEFTPPPHGFRMSGVSCLALCQYGPQSVQLPVFTEKVLPAQVCRMNIPNSHDKLFLSTQQDLLQ